jgi:hypothetical protein
MRRLVRIWFFVLIPLFTKGQGNLVPNWSFEVITDCNYLINNTNSILKASPWFGAYYGTSTDLFNGCDTSYWSVPYNFPGFQYAKTGVSYSGLKVYTGGATSNHYREYAEVKLIDSLQPGKTYCVSFYLNIANYATCGISSIGAKFSNDSLHSDWPNINGILIDTTPDILGSSINSDTLNWTNVSGLYNCLSHQNFITIGNFFDDTNSNVYCPNSISDIYCYLDDVSVVEVSNANAGNDTVMCVGETKTIGGPPTFDAEYTWYELADSANSNSIDSIHIAKPHISPIQTTAYVMWKRQCNVITTDTVIVTVNCVGIKQEERKQELLIYPNPANDKINISYKGNATEINICDLLGKELKRMMIASDKTEIDLAELNNGVYFISVLNNNKIVLTKKFSVQH